MFVQVDITKVFLCTGTCILLGLLLQDEQVLGLSLQASKTALLKTALVSGRGVWASPSEKSQLSRLVSSIEKEVVHNKGGKKETEYFLRGEDNSQGGGGGGVADGCWELIASDLEPFRVSTFFLALASRVESIIRKGASTPALSVHRLATSVSEVERAAWVISDGSLQSLVQLKVGSVPSIPLALDGVVVSSGKVTRSLGDTLSSSSSSSSSPRQRWTITLEDTSVYGNKVLYGLPQETGLTPFVNEDVLKFISNQVTPSGEIFRNVLREEPTAILDVIPVDDDMLIVRVPELDPQSYFVFCKSDPETRPWQDVLDEIEEKKNRYNNDSSNQQQQSLLGSVAALGMLNPFWNRRRDTS